MPVALTRALVGTSLADDLGAEAVDLPFGGEGLLAVPAARPDVALIHAQSADELGNVRRRRPNRSDDIDHVIAASAQQVIVSVEEIEETGTILENRDETLIPGNYVTAVVHAPGGALPTGCDGYYDPDLEALAAHAEASKTPEGIAAFVGALQGART